ncbi:MAG: M15 family metallopeptidase [Polyangiaceae bacterium]|nr:M15 family metallopeptidase [Polyangiaceae bacterium]
MALLSLRKLAVVSLAVIAAGCSEASGVDPEDVHDDHEEAPGEVEQGSEELISNVSCKERTDTAYVKGKASTIKLITVGGKPVSRATGHAFLKMQKAAHAAGVHLAINSGFRTMSEQQYFYNCYLSKKCNNGNLAAKPGFSNHQSGIALDMTTSSWLAKNGTKFGFVRTVPSEPWHWEYTGGSDPGGPCSASGSGSGSGSSTATTLSWASPKNDATIGRSNAVLRVNVTDSKVEKVKFFQGSLHFATATRDSDFEVTYSFKFPGDKTLTAVGVDASGNEVPGAERNIDVTVNQLDRHLCFPFPTPGAKKTSRRSLFLAHLCLIAVRNKVRKNATSPRQRRGETNPIAPNPSCHAIRLAPSLSALLALQRLLARPPGPGHGPS